jgi:long-chain acyl-CoA synthetase
MHRDGEVRFDTVGTVLEGTELRIVADGEILLRSPAVFGGYHGDEPSTAEALRDGWLHTGDAGYLDDGQLVVVDRVRDIAHAPDGARVAPGLVESKLRLSPYVADAVALCGKGRPHVTALLSIDGANVGAWAQRNDLGFTTYAQLAAAPQVNDLIAAHVARVNQDLPESARVKRFVLLRKPLDADEQELTRTRNVRREVIDERYADVIADLYADAAARSA